MEKARHPTSRDGRERIVGLRMRVEGWYGTGGPSEWNVSKGCAVARDPREGVGKGVEKKGVHLTGNEVGSEKRQREGSVGFETW